MAKKLSDNPAFLTGFIAGLIVALVALSLWNIAAFGAYSRPGYMMPWMMQSMMGSRMMYSVTGDCSGLSDSQLVSTGKTFMDNMMGKDFNERMNTALSGDTSKLMYLMMGRVYNNC